MENRVVNLLIFDSFDRNLNSYIAAMAVDKLNDTVLFNKKFGIKVNGERVLGIASLAVSLGVLLQIFKGCQIAQITTNDKTIERIIRGKFNPKRLRNNGLICQLSNLLSRIKVTPVDEIDTKYIDLCLNHLITGDYLQLPSVEEAYGLHKETNRSIQ